MKHFIPFFILGGSMLCGAFPTEGQKGAIFDASPARYERDAAFGRYGFRGLVSTVVVESALLERVKGNWVETHREWVETIRFDMQGRRTELDREECRWMYEWDSTARANRARIVEKPEMTAGGEQVTRHDQLGRVTEILSYYSGQMTMRKTFTYDSSGKRVSQLLDEYPESEKGFLWKDVLSYGEDGSLANVTHLFFDSESSTWISTGKDEYIYDGFGNLMKTITHKPRSLVLSVYTYDRWGNETGYARFESEQHMLVDRASKRRFFYYEYDSEGNWTKKTQFVSLHEGPMKPNRFHGVFHRTVDYYSEEEVLQDSGIEEVNIDGDNPEVNSGWRSRKTDWRSPNDDGPTD
ncbi:MAG: hypothetical protein KAW17_12040 [Candidatus Eisenbacteria sp.]|nr:hypothetical protein [Candidatus Eisenbacteria bacterium]